MGSKPSQPLRVIGKISQVIGPVIDIKCNANDLPEIYRAIEILKSNSNERVSSSSDKYNVQVVTEVQQMMGGNVVRTIAMNPTDGLSRNLLANDTGKAISVPVGNH